MDDDRRPVGRVRAAGRRRELRRHGRAAAELAPLPAPPAEGYAWDDLACRAADRSGEAKALLLDARAARHQAAVDTAWRDPELRLGGRQGEADDQTLDRTPPEQETRSSDAYEIGLRVNISNPFVNRWLRKSGAAAAHAKESESQEASYAIFCEVRSLCREAAALCEEIGLLEQIASLRAQARDNRSRQAAAGVADALDLIQAVTRVAAIRSDIREKEAEHRQLVRRIALLADVPAEQVRLRPSAAEPLPDVSARDADSLADLAFARRPDLARAGHERAAARHAVSAAKAGLVPWFDHVEGTYEDENTRVAAGENAATGYDRIDRDGAEWQLLVAVNIPIFDWRGEKIRLSRAKMAAADVRAAALREEIRKEVAGVRDDYLRACAGRARIAEENRQVQAVMVSKIDALSQEPTVKQEDLLAAREEVVAYGRILLRADGERRRLAQELETVTGGPLESPR
jgi:outer membrane protein TolC